MMRACVFLAVLLAVGLPTAWCVSAFGGSESPWIDVPREPAVAADWQEVWIETDLFDLLAYTRLEQPGARELVVYLEGDGFPWVSLTELSDDPSPRSARVLEMAIADPSPKVAYLARPCFYLPNDDLTGCPSRFWSEARYGEEVVAALDQALDLLKSGAGASSLRLVGFSGGGVLAALLAARRDDVVGIITVSANLDHAVWTTRHNVSALHASLNAADIADQIEHIPQVHYIGVNDKVVGRADVDAYIARMNDPSQSFVVEVPGYNHACCWKQNWIALLAQADDLAFH
ncbi:MAG: alpha/beta hydrolase [Alphaproteobacteria bacterium]|nr:alpha/beta hydrolase [Alphaproteobacteria bacterium]